MQGKQAKSLPVRQGEFDKTKRIIQNARNSILPTKEERGTQGAETLAEHSARRICKKAFDVNEPKNPNAFFSDTGYETRQALAVDITSTVTTALIPYFKHQLNIGDTDHIIDKEHDYATEVANFLYGGNFPLRLGGMLGKGSVSEERVCASFFYNLIPLSFKHCFFNPVKRDPLTITPMANAAEEAIKEVSKKSNFGC